MWRVSPASGSNVSKWQSPSPVRYMRTLTFGSLIEQTSRSVNESESLIGSNLKVGIAAGDLVDRERHVFVRPLAAMGVLANDVANRAIGALGKDRRPAP